MDLFSLARPFLFRIDAERAHRLSILALRFGIVRPTLPAHDPRLAVSVAGLTFANPLGVAAGFDKDGEVPDALARLGFGHIEIGSVTPEPQPGNPRPRVFRLPDHGAAINRFGFNSAGHAALIARLTARSRSDAITGINIGANKHAADFIADYEKGIAALSPFADYFTVNISSPNTPGLRGLQERDRLVSLVSRVIATRDAVAPESGRCPVFLKIAPDLDEAALEDVAETAQTHLLDGMVISNTTLDRQGVRDEPCADEAGGLSGRPLFERSTAVLARMRQLVGEDMPIIGVGGVSDAATALAKIEAGAHLVQLYTGMIYAGPGIAAGILRGLIERMDRDGAGSIAEYRGCKTAEWAARLT